jgi:hypothetical protein
VYITSVHMRTFVGTITVHNFSTRAYVCWYHYCTQLQYMCIHLLVPLLYTTSVHVHTFVGTITVHNFCTHAYICWYHYCTLLQYTCIRLLVPLLYIPCICSSRCVIICNIKLFSLTHLFFIVWYSDQA